MPGTGPVVRMYDMTYSDMRKETVLQTFKPAKPMVKASYKEGSTTYDEVKIALNQNISELAPHILRVHARDCVRFDDAIMQCWSEGMPAGGHRRNPYNYPVDATTILESLVAMIYEPDEKLKKFIKSNQERLIVDLNLNEVLKQAQLAEFKPKYKSEKKRW